MTDDRARQEEAIAAYALGALDAPEQARIAALVRTDPAAARLLAEYRAAADLLPYDLPREAPPPEARAAILARAREGGPRAVSPPTQPRPSRRPLQWAFASALLMALLAWNLVLQFGGAGRPDIARLAGKPDTRTALMINTSAAPDARGQLYLTPDGQRGVIAIAGLPVPPDGRVYQFWFARPDKSRDSAAVFTVDAQGNALIPVSVPGALGQYDQVWVTQEPPGGSAKPTAPHFLEGPL